MITALLSPWLAALCLAAGWAALHGLLPGNLALLGVPAMLWAPGTGWARGEDPVDRLISCLLRSALIAAASVCAGRASGHGAPGALACAGLITALGHLPALALRGPRAIRPAGRWGLPLAGLALLGLLPLEPLLTPGAFWRPLRDHAWHAATESEDFQAALPAFAGGWQDLPPAQAAPAEGVACARPASPAPALIGPGAGASGTALLVLRGPIGAGITARTPDGPRSAWIEADPTEDAEEGPVARYLRDGAVILPLPVDLAPGALLPLSVSQPSDSLVCLIASPVALWDLHAAGGLRIVQRYQLLNMVEQLRWADELLLRRSVTDVQPPGWSYLLAAATMIGGDDLPAVHAAMLAALLLCGLAGLRLIRAWGGSPPPALLLPALGLAHARLLLEPGSGGMPDSLYAAALLLALAALAAPAAPGFARAALLAQLSRYPAPGVALIAAALTLQPRPALRMLLLIAAAAAAFGLYGLWSDQLAGWLATVAWESGPEHWHGEHDPATLLARAPGFYKLWLLYSGGAPLLAAIGIGLALSEPRRRAALRAGNNRPLHGAIACLGTALLYSLLLCTIDHHPTHYFLPLLHLSVLACALLPAADPRLRGWGGIVLGGLVLSVVAAPVV